MQKCASRGLWVLIYNRKKGTRSDEMVTSPWVSIFISPTKWLSHNIDKGNDWHKGNPCFFPVFSSEWMFQKSVPENNEIRHFQSQERELGTFGGFLPSVLFFPPSYCPYPTPSKGTATIFTIPTAIHSPRGMKGPSLHSWPKTGVLVCVTCLNLTILEIQLPSQEDQLVRFEGVRGASKPSYKIVLLLSI